MRSLPKNRALTERLFGLMWPVALLCGLILLRGFGLGQSHLKPALADTEGRSVLIELAGVTNSLKASPPAASGNLSDETAGQTPPGSFASSDRLPLYFVENQGQVDSQNVSHYVQGRDRTIYFASDGLTFALLGESGPISGVQGFDPDTNALASSRLGGRPPTSRWVVKLDFLDASSRVQPTGQGRTRAVVSYFKGPPDQRTNGWQISPPSRSLSILICGPESTSFIPVRFND